MKFNFKRISAVTSSLLVAGMSVATPLAAANYPQPFVDGSDSDVAIVHGTGTGVSSLDLVQAGNIQSDLQDQYTGGSSGGANVGEGENINIGDILGDLALGDTIGVSLYDDDLPTILSSGEVDGEDYDQSLIVSGDQITYDTLGDEDNYQVNTDLASTLDPVLYVDMSSGVLWTYNLDFDTSLDAQDAGNEEIEIAGRSYTIDPNLEDAGSTSDNLVLYASTNTETFDYQDSKTVSVDGESYNIEVVGGRDLSTDPEATVNIDGSNYRVNAGDTVTHDGEDFYINEIFMNTFGEESSMSVEIFVGAQKIEIPQGTEGYIEVDEEIVDSVRGHYTGTLDAVTGIELTFTPTNANYDYDADYNEYNYLEIGESITDPVLGTINVVFDSMGQDFTEDKETVEIRQSGDTLQVVFTNEAGDEYSANVLDEGNLNLLSGSDFEALTMDDRREKLVLNKEGSEGTISHIAEIYNIDRDGDNITSVTFSYEGELEEVNMEDAMRRSADSLYVCYGSNNSFASGGVENKSEFSLQGAACAYDDTASANLYDGSLDAVYAMNDITIDMSALTGTGGNITVTETNDDLGGSNNDVVFNATYDSADTEYTVVYVEGAQGAEDDEGDYGYYLTNLGSYIETEADDNTWARMHTPEEEVTYDVFVASDVSSEDGEDGLGDVLVKDTEVSSVDDKNLIVVGGSCINSVAADILGGSYCGAQFTDETGVGPNQFLIQGVEGAYTSGKIALLVAGYEAEDTVNAATYLRTQDVDTSKKYIGTSSTSADLVTEEA